MTGSAFQRRGFLRGSSLGPGSEPHIVRVYNGERTSHLSPPIPAHDTLRIYLSRSFKLLHPSLPSFQLYIIITTMSTRFLTFTFLACLSLLTVARRHNDIRSPAYVDLLPGSLVHRTLTGQTIAFSCYGGGGDCECPGDLNGDSGVLINVFPGFQCAYAGGACTWDDKVSIVFIAQMTKMLRRLQTGTLQNTAQTNCPVNASCSLAGGCSCPRDNNGDTGVLINQFTGYQCAYAGGACTWNSVYCPIVPGNKAKTNHYFGCTGRRVAKYLADELCQAGQVQAVGTGFIRERRRRQALTRIAVTRN